MKKYIVYVGLVLIGLVFGWLLFGNNSNEEANHNHTEA